MKREMEADLFRREALEYRLRAAVHEGGPLKLSTAPMRWIFWVLLSAVGAGLLFGSIAPLSEFAIGPAIVRVDEAMAAPGGNTQPLQAGGCSLTAYLPVRYLPHLRPGLSARIVLTGMQAEESVTLDTLDPQILPAQEIRRILGDPGALPSNEPAVVVVQRLDSCVFRTGAREMSYAEGMRATLEVKVGSRSILASLLPGLSS